jgi:hypothetical protein
MAIALPNFPLVQGNYYSWASLSPIILGVVQNPLAFIHDVSYTPALEPGEVWLPGTPLKAGRTRGQSKPTASITFYKQAFDAYVQMLGAGWMEQSQSFSFSYRETYNVPIVTDQIIGARITKADQSYSDGIDALMVKCDLNVMDIICAGVPSVFAQPGF